MCSGGASGGRGDDEVVEAPSTATKIHMLLIKYIGRGLLDNSKGEVYRQDIVRRLVDQP